MTRAEQVNAFASDIRAVIRRYSHEFELTVTEAIGVLQIQIIDIHNTAARRGEEE